MKRTLISLITAAVLISAPALAQTAVEPAANPDKLFTSADPQLNANKQVVYRIIRDLLEANHWDLAPQYIAEDYIQHNPNAADGLKAVVDFFTLVLKVKPTAIPETIGFPVVEVMAEGDLVTVISRRRAVGPNGPYTTAWFDTWRIRDGKAVEHWDPALMNEAPDLSK